MAVKETIAIVADKEEMFLNIALKLHLEKYLVLFVAKNAVTLSEALTNIKKQTPTAEIEVIDCVKDGCWEADIIILCVNDDEQNEVAAMIKEVATQKIVVSFLKDVKGIEILQKLLPYSKVVSVVDSGLASDALITSDDTDAAIAVSDIFRINN